MIITGPENSILPVEQGKKKKKLCVENDTPFFAVVVVHYATQAQAHLTIFLKQKSTKNDPFRDVYYYNYQCVFAVVVMKM